MKKLLLIFMILFSFNLYGLDFKNNGKESYSSGVKVYGATVPTTFLLYSFHPDLIAGWNTKLYSRELKYINDKYKNLPILGGWYGNGNYPNKETLLQHKIDTAIVVDASRGFNDKIESYMKSINIPLIAMKTYNLEDDKLLYKKLGELFQMSDRSKAIIDYIDRADKNLKSVVSKVSKKKKVYFAMEEDGLTTRCPDIIKSAGGENVHKCVTFSERLNLEQLYIYNPEYIVTTDIKFYKDVYKNKKWKRIKAVKDKNVILFSDEPFSWIEKKTFMYYFTVQLLASRLYPEYSSIDLKKEIMEHFKVFMHHNLTEEMAEKLLNPEKYLD